MPLACFRVRVLAGALPYLVIPHGRATTHVTPPPPGWVREWGRVLWPGPASVPRIVIPRISTPSWAGAGNSGATPSTRRPILLAITIPIAVDALSATMAMDRHQSGTCQPIESERSGLVSLNPTDALPMTLRPPLSR